MSCPSRACSRSLALSISAFPGHWLKAEIVDAIAASARAPFPRILDLLRRDELKTICRAAGIDDSGREKAVIADRILGRSLAGGFDKLTRAQKIPRAHHLVQVDGLLPQPHPEHPSRSCGGGAGAGLRRGMS